MVLASKEVISVCVKTMVEAGVEVEVEAIAVVAVEIEGEIAAKVAIAEIAEGEIARNLIIDHLDRNLIIWIGLCLIGNVNVNIIVGNT
jgi:hypothetical protein